MQDDILIAVMGAPGSGKSRFINTVAGSNLSAKSKRGPSPKDLPSVSFIYQDRKIVFIDMPAFDDLHISDTDTLGMIADWLTVGYGCGKLLHGVLYLHQISDLRVSGVSYRNMKLFHELCGKRAMKNVIICTTMWDIVESDIAEARETELLGRFWSTMTTQGARSARHRGTRESALNIID
ncbi:hypothetical protein FRC03_012165 [Tulasnella sp. 419]|nr:hypothetical protein FRC03_012165 [Tulasnella sp. 419]